MRAVLDWFTAVGRQLTSVPVWAIVAVTVLRLVQSLLNGLAWTVTLRAAYPDAPIRYRHILAADMGGVAINQVAPAQAGTVTMHALFLGMIPGASVPGLAGAQVAQTLFYAVAGAVLYIVLLLGQPGFVGVLLGPVTAHPVVTAVIVAALAAITVVVVRRAHRRIAHVMRTARDGAAILRTPRRYLLGVALPQAGVYGLRLATMAILMHVFGVTATLGTVLLMQAAGSLANFVSITPGGIGVEQAIASAALYGAATSATVAAYSFGQQILLAAINIAAGLVALMLAFGRRGTGRILRDAWHRVRGPDDVGPGPDRRRPSEDAA